MRKLLIPLVVGLTVFFSQVATEVSAQTPEYFTPELTQDLGSTVIDVNGDPEALAAVCARISAGEIVEGVIYDCSAFPAFQIVCTDPERSSMDCFPDATPAPDSCWDCVDSSMTPEEGRAIYCSAQSLKENPQMLDECFPDKWEWVCFPEGNCEMYRRDLDPLGIFATPTPEPTPTVVPTPEATETVVAP